jgi:hypothetical protein
MARLILLARDLHLLNRKQWRNVSVARVPAVHIQFTLVTRKQGAGAGSNGGVTGIMGKANRDSTEGDQNCHIVNEGIQETIAGKYTYIDYRRQRRQTRVWTVRLEERQQDMVLHVKLGFMRRKRECIENTIKSDLRQQQKVFVDSTILSAYTSAQPKSSSTQYPGRRRRRGRIGASKNVRHCLWIERSARCDRYGDEVARRDAFGHVTVQRARGENEIFQGFANDKFNVLLRR